MAQPRALILTGYGINCDEETKFAFETAGAKAEIVHVNDLIGKQKKLSDYQILAFPGGFSYGDDTGSGNALANRIKNHIWDEMVAFASSDNLAIGICNGFQVMANLGLLPALDGNYGERKIALMHNESAKYLDRWVDLEFHGKGPWVNGLESMSVPIAHGEGKFFAEQKTLRLLNERGLVACRYASRTICHYQNLPANPNGSLEDIAGITDETGRLIGMMPHPERAIHFTHRPDWHLLKEKLKRQGLDLPSEGEALKIFRNGVDYFK